MMIEDPFDAIEIPAVSIIRSLIHSFVRSFIHYKIVCKQ